MDENVCAICLDGLYEGIKESNMQLICDHQFHKQCIQLWFDTKSNCPVCRTQTNPITEEIRWSLDAMRSTLEEHPSNSMALRMVEGSGGRAVQSVSTRLALMDRINGPLASTPMTNATRLASPTTGAIITRLAVIARRRQFCWNVEHIRRLRSRPTNLITRPVHPRWRL